MGGEDWRIGRVRIEMALFRTMVDGGGILVLEVVQEKAP